MLENVSGITSNQLSSDETILDGFKAALAQSLNVSKDQIIIVRMTDKNQTTQTRRRLATSSIDIEIIIKVGTQDNAKIVQSKITQTTFDKDLSTNLKASKLFPNGVDVAKVISDVAGISWFRDVDRRT